MNKEQYKKIEMILKDIFEYYDQVLDFEYLTNEQKFFLQGLKKIHQILKEKGKK